MTLTEPTVGGTLSLRAGQRVRLRPWSEIEATLDAEGRTGKLPFMGEMLALQGKVLTVDSRADKTCDTVNLTGTNRAMTNTVHLSGVRCDGSAHGGCQAYCLLWFREEWLERAPANQDQGATAPAAAADAPSQELVERLERFADNGPGYYRCQATHALEASRPLLGRSHYLTDLRTRNVRLGVYVRFLSFWVLNKYQSVSKRVLPGFLRIREGRHFPDVTGEVVDGNWPAGEALDLQPGELVEMRSMPEIRATLDHEQSNRGLWFDKEMAALSGRRGRVLHRVTQLIDEKTGKMLKVKKDLYIVEGFVGCTGAFHQFCTRGVMAMVRDAWLRRVE